MDSRQQCPDSIQIDIDSERCGTSLQVIFEDVELEKRGRFASLDTGGDRRWHAPTLRALACAVKP